MYLRSSSTSHIETPRPEQRCQKGDYYRGGVRGRTSWFSPTMFRLARAGTSTFVRGWTRQFSASSSRWAGKNLGDLFPENDRVLEQAKKKADSVKVRPEPLEAGTPSDNPHLTALYDMARVAKDQRKEYERELDESRHPGSSRPQLSASVRIFDVPDAMRKEDVYELFSSFGEVTDVIISTSFFHHASYEPAKFLSKSSAKL